MKINEIINESLTESKLYTGVFPDGVLKLTHHFDDERRIERDIDMDQVLDMCHRAGKQWPEKIAEFHDESFVIVDWDGLGVALVKQETSPGKYTYILKTARNPLRIGMNQQVIRLR